MIFNLGVYYGARRDWQKAAEKGRTALELGLDLLGHYGLFWVYGAMRMYDQMEKEAEAFARYIQDTKPRIRTFLDAFGAYFKGDKDTVRRLLPELEAHPKETNTSLTEIAGLHFFLGDVDKGFEWLEQAYSKREGLLLHIQWDWDRLFDGIRTDPRYLDLLKRLGLARESEGFDRKKP
jgi:tetratricopeptide (TPR) repeat protein